MENQSKYLWRAQNPIPPCNICNMEFSNGQRKSNHMIKVHGEAPPFQCDECPYWCLFEGQMKKHKHVHLKKRGCVVGPDNESLYTACYVCGKNISGNASSAHFQDHLRTHEEGEQQWPCSHPGCGQIFKSKSTLQRYTLTFQSQESPQFTNLSNFVSGTTSKLIQQMKSIYARYAAFASLYLRSENTWNKYMERLGTTVSFAGKGSNLPTALLHT